MTRRRPIPPLATLRANWTPPSRRGTGTVSGRVAQGCEYGRLMGPEALRRQWMGSQKSYREVARLLGFVERHLRAVA